ncbi:MAG: aspartyl/asparaginyl beta-hydroxylase domain-containing protein [Sphingopyxis sp.]
MTMAPEQPMTALQAFQHAQACRRQGDIESEIAALHIVLRHNARDMGALLAMGECFARQSDERAAISWFRTALAQASVTPPPTSLHPMLKRAEAYVVTTQARFTAHLNAEIAASGAAGSGSPMFKHALALLKGEAELHFQQPSMFYYPGLPQRAFYERHEFDWVTDFEAQADTLLNEFRSLAEDAQAFIPYVLRSASRPAPNNHLLEDAAWGAAYLWRDGAITDLGQRVTQTMAALAHTPQPVITRRSPMALYSRLMPGTHIKPHFGMLNTRLICHLPLIVPEGCGLRVGHETREWRYGEMLVFDDSMEHEAWNRGTSERTILLFEIWRPEIPPEDREALTLLFAAIDKVDPSLGQESSG